MEPSLDLDTLTALRVLGRGSMGTVFLVTDHSSRPPFALKVLDKSSSPHPSADRRARWEISVLRRLRHPFLPSLLATSDTPDLLAWALPFCPAGDLNALRHSLPDRVLSSSALRFYLAELISALSHLHSLSIVYRDLKPENILIQASGHLLLTDFDLSRHLSREVGVATSPPNIPLPHKRHRRNLTRIFLGVPATTSIGVELKKTKSARVSPAHRRMSGSGNGEKSHSFVGTEEYVSPEVVRGDGHEFAVDWWALGILTYELAYGRTPFKGRNRKETFKNVLMKQPEYLGRRRSELTDLIGRLLEKDPKKRLGYKGGAEEVKSHPFFKGVQWEMLEEVARPPFFATAEELEEAMVVEEGVEGFDVRDYFNRLRQRAAEEGEEPPVGLSDF